MSDVTFPHTPVRDTSRRDDTTYLGAMIKRTSWGAVVAGAVTAISLQLLFSVLGVAIGATTAGTAYSTGDGTPEKIGMAAGLWWLVTGTISLFIGGCVVGRFSGMVRSADVLLHALVMWAVTAIFGFAVVSGAGMGLTSGIDSFSGGNAHHRMTGGSSTTADPRGAGDRPRVILASDKSAAPSIPSAEKTLDDGDIESARRVVQNAAWWTLVALVVGIGVSLGGAWSIAPHRIVVRPTTAPD